MHGDHWILTCQHPWYAKVVFLMSYYLCAKCYNLVSSHRLLCHMLVGSPESTYRAVNHFLMLPGIMAVINNCVNIGVYADVKWASEYSRLSSYGRNTGQVHSFWRYASRQMWITFIVARNSITKIIPTQDVCVLHNLMDQSSMLTSSTIFPCEYRHRC